MEKPDTLSGVGERQKECCRSLAIHRCLLFFLSTKAVYFKLAFVAFILFLHLTHYINSSSINNVSSLLLPQTLHLKKIIKSNTRWRKSQENENLKMIQKCPKGYTAKKLRPSDMLLFYKGEQMAKEEKLQAFQEYRGAREFASQWSCCTAYDHESKALISRWLLWKRIIKLTPSVILWWTFQSPAAQWHPFY